MSEIEGLTPEAIQAGVKAYETGMSDDGRSRPECIVLAYFAIQEALATTSPAVRTPEDQVERVARAIDADLDRQAHVQRGVTYYKADECGVAVASLNIVVAEVARAAIAALASEQAAS